MKKYKYFLLFLLLAVFIFASFTLLNPMLKKTPLSDKQYSIDTKNMNIRKRPPMFYRQDNGIFFVHPSTEVNATGTFTFGEGNKQFWHFSIQKGSPVGEILFVIKKNGEELRKFVVNTKQDIKVDIKVNKKDKITVIADPLGATSGDWGNLEIENWESNYIFKLRIIPILWILFFIYLINKGYIYIAFNSYFGFLLTIIAEKISYGALSFSAISMYTAFFFLIAFIFMLIYQELRILKKLKIASLISWIFTIIIYTIPISFIIFYLVFNKPIDWNILFAVYQTNPDEAIGFIESFVSISYLLAILFFSLLLGYLFLHQEIKKRQVVERSLLAFIIIILVGFISANIYKARIPNLIHDTFVDYNSQIERLLAFQEKHKTSKIKYSATKKEKGELYVVVIGESLYKNSMGIYGHFRDTTPKQSLQVKNDNLQVFSNTYSNASNTMRSLSYALTEANQYNGKDFLKSLSFIDIFNKAGFDTYWLSTQVLLGESNTIVSVIAKSSKHTIDLLNSVKVKTGLSSTYDEITIDELRTKITKSKGKNRLIIIHLYGNHFKYSDRYPKNYSKYKNTKPYMIGTDKKYILDDYSKYDNSVLYNDYVVSSLLNVVKEQGGVSTFLYFSDHGEDIIRHRGHTSRLDGFTYTMSQIPFTAWLSPEYLKSYPGTYKAFIANKDKLFSSDMIYDTILGLAHINTNRYNAKYDLSSSKYNLDYKKALTLHGRLKYAAPENYYFWRKHNTKLLKDNNLTKKIVITNTDTVGKLNEAWRLGYRSFELDLNYTESKNSFKIGGKSYDTQGDTSKLFSFFKSDKIKNLFLNIKNLSKTNLDSAVSRLNEINNQLNIKEKIVILTDKINLLKIVKDKGFKVALIDNQSPTNSKLADYLVVDNKSYNSIKDSSNLDNIILAHTFNIADSKLQKMLSNLKYIHNKDINFVFADFTSEFDE